MVVADFDPARKAVLLRLGLAPNKKVFRLNGYPAVFAAGRKIKYVHRLVAEVVLEKQLTRQIFVHHKDEDRTNFPPTNLEVCSHGEHNGLHRRSGPDNHFFGRTHSAEVRARLAQVAKAREMPRDLHGKFLGVDQ